MSTEPKIDWSKPLQTVRGWKVRRADITQNAASSVLWITSPSGHEQCLGYQHHDNGKVFGDELPHGENPYDLMNVPEPEPASDPIEALRAEVAELRERLAKIEAEKQAEGVAVEGVDWSKPLETKNGLKVRIWWDDCEAVSYPKVVQFVGDLIEYRYTRLGKYCTAGEHPLDLRNVVST